MAISILFCSVAEAVPAIAIQLVAILFGANRVLSYVFGMMSLLRWPALRSVAPRWRRHQSSVIFTSLMRRWSPIGFAGAKPRRVKSVGVWRVRNLILKFESNGANNAGVILFNSIILNLHTNFKIQPSGEGFLLTALLLLETAAWNATKSKQHE